MNGAEGWGSPGHLRRYRDRVFAERNLLRRALVDAGGHQQRVLEDLVGFNAKTEFGREYGFDRIRTVEDLRRAVPVQDYAAHAERIERTAAGETNLLSADRPAAYFTSSGSTGAHKKIPVTPAFMRTTFFPFYYAAWAPLAEHVPEALAHPDAVLNLKHDPLVSPPVTKDGSPHAGASQTDFGAAFGEPLSAEPGTAAHWSRLPPETAADAHVRKMYLRLRLAVESDVRCLIGINPAMIAAVPYQLNLWWERIVKEVHDGTLGGVPYGEGAPARAAELEWLAEHFGTVRPAQVWPRMRALFCWTTGAAALYLPRLREEFGPGVTLLSAPVAASEGPVGVALDRHPSAGSLVVTASVFEFIDAQSDVAPSTETLLPHELEPGRDYHVLYSHIGGLYRYAVGDVVRVLDQVGGAPRLEYAGRATQSDVAGERLRDAQVVRALLDAQAGTGLGMRNAACRVQPSSGGGHQYQFALAPFSPWNARETSHFTELLDLRLQHHSPGYRQARHSRRLTEARLQLLDRDAFDRDWHAAVAEGVRPTQVKDRIFRQDSALWQRLTGSTTNA